MRHLTISLAVFACLVAALVLVLGAEVRAVVFDDGQLHVIDANNSFPLEGVEVFDGPSGTTTSLFVVPGGRVGSIISLFDSSIGNISGGDMHDVDARDSASLVFSGGRARNVVARDQSSLIVTGGSGDAVGAADNATAEIRGGTFIDEVVAQGVNAVTTVFGGSFQGPGHSETVA